MAENLIEKILAAAGLLVCVALLARMLMAPAQRQRIAARWQAMRRWPTARRVARTEAERAIEHARRGTEVERRGNVYRPKAWDDDSRPPTRH
jgi:hypothetical protein